MAQNTSSGFHIEKYRVLITWKLVVVLLLLSSTTAYLSNSGGKLAPPSAPIQRQSYQSKITLLSALNNRKNKNNNDKSISPPSSDRRNLIAGLLFPLTIALGANAPFLYVMTNPPSAEEREVMLMDFCKGDVCTLLGGGSGFVGGDSGGEYAGDDVARSLPTVEDYEDMAAKAAELN